MCQMYCRSLSGLTLTITLPVVVGLIGLFLPRAVVRRGEGGGACVIETESVTPSLTCRLKKYVSFFTFEDLEIDADHL